MTFAGLRVEYKANARDFIRETKKARTSSEKLSSQLRKQRNAMRQEMPRAVRGYSAALRKLDRKMEASAKKMQAMTKALTGMDIPFKRFAKTSNIVAAGLTAVTGAAVMTVRHLGRVSKEMREINNFSRQMGADPRSLATLAEAVRSKTGMPADQTGDAMRTLNERIKDALEGQGSAVDAFKRLGVTPGSLAGKSVEDQFESVLDAFMKLDRTSKALTATDLFGDEGAKMLGAFSTMDDHMQSIAAAAERVDASMLVESKWSNIERIADKIATRLTTAADKVLAAFIPGGGATGSGDLLAGAAEFGLRQSMALATLGVSEIAIAKSNYDIRQQKRQEAQQKEREKRIAEIEEGSTFGREMIARNMIREPRGGPAPTAERRFEMGQFKIRGGAGGVLGGIRPRSERRIAEDSARFQAQQGLKGGANMLGRLIGGGFNFGGKVAGVAEEPLRALFGGSKGPMPAMEQFGPLSSGAGAMDEVMRIANRETPETSTGERTVTLLERIAKAVEEGGKGGEGGDYASKLWKGIFG